MVVKALAELLNSHGGVLVRRRHGHVGDRLDHCLRTGQLQAALPGIYTVADPSWGVLTLAAARYRPDAVITGAAAARLLWWPDCPITRVTAAVGSGRIIADRAGFGWERRRVPAELITHRDGIGIAKPAMSVLDLIPMLGGRVIDEALRRRAVRLPQLWEALALCPGRRGNALRRDLLHDSRDSPWSEAERDAHRLLRAAGLTGFRTNHRVEAMGQTYWVDIAFPELRVIVEIDGWQYHGGRVPFVKDRWRYSRLSAAGWMVLPMAAEALTTDPAAFVEVVRAALGWGREEKP